MQATVGSNERRPSNKSWRYALFAAVVLVGYYLVKEHRAHVLAVLPFVLLAACPLMHLFMHRGHSKRHSGSDDEGPHSTHH
jgi:hypothetical protein